ncbi:condensation domain-containing protein [Labrenzia sp. OB1]|uniref:condensation domain-containing protein n=1 Tax=Labrenzia sp. OB1 TaxID=1561204 RepID=UPI000838D79E|nr:condensation domain-containing protein [Labrenzia sp. OB1]
MTGGFDRLLTESELEHFDEMLKSQEDHNQGAGEAVRTSDTWSLSEPLGVTQHQERIWLAQQQDPALTLRHALAYRLGGIPEIARLTRAVDGVVGALPELTMRYRFSDDGELVKHQAGEQGDTLEIVNVDSRQEAIALILARQQAPWVSDSEPPFKALVIFCLDEVILGLLMHRIVEEMCTPEDVLKNLARAYDRKPFLPQTTNRVEDLDLTFRDVAPVAWLCREEPGAAIAEFGASSLLPAASGRYAHRYGAVIETGILPSPSHLASDISGLLAFIGTRFARLLCRFGGHEQIEISFPAKPEDRLGDHSAAFSFRDSLKVRISRDTALQEDESRLFSLLSHANENTQANDVDLEEALPKVSVKWLTDPHLFFDARTVTLERVPLPTFESRPDFELAIGRDAEGRTLLELVTGQKVSPHAGNLMLDLFTQQLKTETGKAAEGGQPVSWPVSMAGDRPVAELAGSAEEEHGADSAAIQSAILFEFREALATPELTAADDFFDFGGHSLVATRIIGRLLHNHGIEVRFNDLFGNPTASALARHARLVESAKKSVGNGSVEISTGNTDAAIAPLALAQMSLWKIYSALGYNEIFNLPFALDFLDTVDEAVFGEAFLDLMKRHAGLRTQFFEDEEGEVLQKVVPVSELETHKWFWTSGESTGADRRTEAGYCFDLSKELPVRLRFLKDPETGRQVLSFLFQHLALDEWSVNLLMDELVEAYGARAAGSEPVWSGNPAPFHDFARKQVQAGVNKEHLAYWTDMLADAPRELVLFVEAPAPAEQPDSEAVAGGWVEMRLEKEISEGLYAIAKENSASLFNVVYAAISAALQRIGNLTDLVIGTSASGRTDPDFFDTIGYFTTVVAHRVRFAGEPTVGTLIGNVKDMINGSMPYTDIPIDLVESALGMTSERDHLFDVFIQIHAQNKLNGNLPKPDGGRIAFRQVDPDKHESHLGLQFEVMEEVIDGDRAIRVLMSYQSRRYSPQQVDAIQAAVMNTFSQFSRPGVSLTPLSELTQA